ncbi:MAG TPA: PH domain-containing protein [Brevefilum fermentans]|nr:PH domain-containing protein [Brevefilum fermentans]
MDHAFYPPRSAGILLQGGLMLAFVGAGGFFFSRASQDPSGVNFLLYMLIALILLVPLPLLGYRLYALNNAVYILRREGLMIRWGLRREDIPLNSIEWMRPANEIGFRLPLPWLRWPGAFLGRRTMAELGQVEYLSSDLRHMILVATPSRIFAISPEDVRGFMATFQRMNELGSLTPLDAQSVFPQVFIGRVWEDPIGRWLVLGGLGLGLIVLLVVAIAVPGLEEIQWVEPGTTAPGERLLLLPVLNSLVWIINLGAGTLLYRRGQDLKIAAYILWGTSVLTGLLMLVGSLLLIF